MTREEFLRLAADGYNRIPLSCETLADFDTPLSIYLKLADGPNSYLLESVQGGEKWGRYSIIGLPCRTVLRVYGHQASIRVDGVETERFECADPLAFVEEFKARYQVPTIAGLPRFNGGLVGYFGYDCVRYVEKRLATCPNPDPLGNPDILLMVSDAVVVFDNLAGKIHAIVLADPAQADAYDKGQAHLEELLERLRQPITPRRGLDLERRQRPGAAIPRQLHPRGLRAGGGYREGLHPGRRLHAGGAVAAHVHRLQGGAHRPVPRAALLQPDALHVLLQLRRLPCRGQLAGGAGARRGWPGDRAPDRRHPPAWRHRRGRPRAGRRPAVRRQGNRRAPDAHRPGPQRRRSRVADRQR